MLRNNKDRICAFFAADYDLRLGTRLSAAADAICESREPERAGVGANSFYDFQWPTARERLLLGPKRTAIETLGLAPWVDDFDALFDAVDSALAALNVSIVHRAGFKVVAYLPLQMNHAEASDLMFGSFLAEKEMLSPVLGERLDPLVLIEAEFSGFKYVLQWTALTPEQASRTFLGLGNLDKFVDQRLIDTSVKEFHDRIAHADCMLFDLDLFQNEVPAAKLREFAKSALDCAETIAENCMRHLCSQPGKRAVKPSRLDEVADAVLEQGRTPTDGNLRSPQSQIRRQRK